MIGKYTIDREEMGQYIKQAIDHQDMSEEEFIEVFIYGDVAGNTFEMVEGVITYLEPGNMANRYIQRNDILKRLKKSVGVEVYEDRFNLWLTEYTEMVGNNIKENTQEEDAYTAYKQSLKYLRKVRRVVSSNYPKTVDYKRCQYVYYTKFRDDLLEWGLNKHNIDIEGFLERVFEYDMPVEWGGKING